MIRQPSLQPGDIPVALRLVSHPGEGFEPLAEALGTSLSSAHRSVARLRQAGLLRVHERKVNPEALREFLVHGVRYAFPPVRGPEARGVPTAWSAPGLAGELPQGPAVVWPSEHGSLRGEAVTPLADSVPTLVLRDPWMHEMLSLVDALRLGQARDRKMAAKALAQRLGTVEE